MIKLKNGIALNSELSSHEFRLELKNCKKSEQEFLKKENLFRDKSYRWPKSAINNWGRIWEYPFVSLAIKSLLKNEKASILDFGSGITFFPYMLANNPKIKEIYTLDNDLVCVEGNSKASLVFSKEGEVPKIIPLYTESGSSIRLEPNSIDLVYSISVIEHLENYEEIINEIFRILKPGGYFAVTLDVDLRGDFALSQKQYKEFFDLLSCKFSAVFPNVNYHPLDILTTLNSPLQSERRTIFGRIKGLVKDVYLGSLRTGYRDYKLNISCYGGVFMKIKNI
jgi:SAM-dependent methyltransferase